MTAMTASILTVERQVRVDAEEPALVDQPMSKR